MGCCKEKDRGQLAAPVVPRNGHSLEAVKFNALVSIYQKEDSSETPREIHPQGPDVQRQGISINIEHYVGHKGLLCSHFKIGNDGQRLMEENGMHVILNFSKMCS